MKFPEYRYIDVAIGGVNKRNNVKDITEFQPPQDIEDSYRTVFRFNESYLQHYKKNNSVAKFSGECYADWLPFDIDDSNLKDAYKKTKNAIAVLELEFSIDVKYLFFSGAKGFHILIPSEAFGVINPSQNLPFIFKNIANDILGDICDQSIYDINRLFRYNNTINTKTGLYKIQISLNEFERGIESIKELAKNSRNFPRVPFSDNTINTQLKELYEKYMNESAVGVKDSKSLEYDNLWEGIKNGTHEGNRDVFTTKYAGLLKSKGLSVDDVYAILHGWNKSNNPPLSEEQLKKVINSVFHYKDQSQEIDGNIKPIWSIADEYEDYVKSSKKANIGITEIDTKIRGIRPGQVMTFMGFTGNFKTATIQNILKHYSQYSGEPVLMFEMEMPNLDLFERAMQMETGISGKDIEDIFKSDDQEAKQDMIAHLKECQGNFYVVDLPALSFNVMKNYIIAAEENIYKKKTGLVGIDFIQLMGGKGKTNTERMDLIAKEMKSFAKELHVPLIVISQVTDVEDEYTEVDLMDARDSKTIAQMSDYVITMWKEKDTDSQILSLRKNRKGGLVKVRRTIDKKSLRFKDLDSM